MTSTTLGPEECLVPTDADEVNYQQTLDSDLLDGATQPPRRLMEAAVRRAAVIQVRRRRTGGYLKGCAARGLVALFAFTVSVAVALVAIGRLVRLARVGVIVIADIGVFTIV